MLTTENFLVEVYPPLPEHGMLVGIGGVGIKVTHIPSKEFEISTNERSQYANKHVALSRLIERLQPNVPN